jgi:hypothetical protein
VVTADPGRPAGSHTPDPTAPEPAAPDAAPPAGPAGPDLRPAFTGDTFRPITHWFLGPGHQARLTVTHCVHSAAEAFFTVSMAGSIFFSVSPDAARPRVLLFLVLTLAPFLVMAPLIGPIVDRVRGGLPAVMITTFGVRAILAVALAQHLRDLLLFPLAFGILVVAKTYTVTRNGLVPSIVEDEQDLVSANARLSRSATIVAAFAAGGAVALYTATSASTTLRVAAAIYVVGIASAAWVRAVARPVGPLDHDAEVELVRPDVSGAVWDMMALRAAVGFLLFHLGFSLRAAGEPAWVLGGVIVANGLGGFVGTVVSPLLRRRMAERSMLTAALLGPALAIAVCGLAFNLATLIAAVFVLGLGVSVGRRALDATMQRLAPHARRGQVYASLETRLELVWVLAACLAVALRTDTWIGVIVLALFLLVVALAHLRRVGAEPRLGPAKLRPLGGLPLADRLLMRAETLADRGYHDEAMVLARAATEAARWPSTGDADDHEEQSRLAIERARQLIDEARDRP